MTRPALALALLLALAALVAGHWLPAPGRYGVTLVLLTAGVTLAVQADRWLRADQPPKNVLTPRLARSPLVSLAKANSWSSDSAQISRLPYEVVRA